jgi:hypothetical protein
VNAPLTAGTRPRFSALRLLAKGLVLLLVSLVTVTAVVLLVPDGNDYATTSLRKHARLTMDQPRKIVFVGGSNLMFGLDSQLIERETGSHVVNMGMNGYFGARFMLSEVKASLRAPDVVVVSLEYDNFFKSVDGTSSDLLMVAKANPRAFRYLSWKQRSAVARAVPYVAQQKLLRLMREGMRYSVTGSRGLPEDEIALTSIESAAGVNEYGDMTSHVGVAWPWEREDGLDLTRHPLDGQVVGLLQSFAAEMQARGVAVLVSYTPAIDYYYRKHKQSIDHVHVELSRSAPLVVPRPPQEFVFAEPLFFDTVYHLNEKGRKIRTEKVIRDLEPYLKNRQSMR